MYGETGTRSSHTAANMISGKGVIGRDDRPPSTDPSASGVPSLRQTWQGKVKVYGLPVCGSNVQHPGGLGGGARAAESQPLTAPESLCMRPTTARCGVKARTLRRTCFVSRSHECWGNTINQMPNILSLSSKILNRRRYACAPGPTASNSGFQHTEGDSKSLEHATGNKI